MIHNNLTKNKTFILTNEELKQLDVINNEFMLELHNEELLNIDPFSPDLTDQEKSAIIKECTINPWYFLREIVRIPNNGELKPFELNQGNTAMLYLFFNGINTAVCLPTMCGKTTSALCGILWYYNFIDNQNILFGNKTLEESIDNLDIFNTIQYTLPDYIQDIKKSNVVDTMDSNKIDEPQYNIHLFDNYEFINNIDSIVSKATSLYTDNNSYRFICVSTPGDLSTDEGESSSKVIADTMDFDERMYDMTTQGLRSFVSKIQ